MYFAFALFMLNAFSVEVVTQMPTPDDIAVFACILWCTISPVVIFLCAMALKVVGAALIFLYRNPPWALYPAFLPSRRVMAEYFFWALSLMGQSLWMILMDDSVGLSQWFAWPYESRYRRNIVVETTSTKGESSSEKRRWPATTGFLTASKPVGVEKESQRQKQLLWDFTYKPVLVSETTTLPNRFSGSKRFVQCSQFKPATVEMARPMKHLAFKDGFPAGFLSKYKPAKVSETSAEEKKTSPTVPSPPRPSKPNVIANLEKASEEDPKQTTAGHNAQLDVLADALSAIALGRDPEVDALADTLSAVSLGQAEDVVEGSEAMEVESVVEDITKAGKRKALVLEDVLPLDCPEDVFVTRFTKSVKVYAHASVATGLAQFVRTESKIPYRSLGDFRLRKGRSAANQAAQERRRNAAINKERAAMIRYCGSPERN
ncbi:hypothetical protein CPC08DRAFT_818950 [Agrocybe pediades]|nr:hypothetical protein CPC08DRAFT_818950 [Agrocybe pediades]